MTDRCSIADCRAEALLDYLGHGVCDDHWNEFMDGAQPPGALKAALGITEPEEHMAKKKTETPNADAAPEVAAAPEAAPSPTRKRTPKAKPAETVATTTTTETPTPEKAARKSAKAPAPELVPATPDAPKPDLVVFAFRLTQAERDAIHTTAGPRNATQFVRRVAVAFAHEDKSAFETVVKEARTLRG